MRITDSCAQCLYDKQKYLTDNEEYLAEIRHLLDRRKKNDTSPYMVYLFNQVYEKHFGKHASYKDIKKKYNDLVLSIEDTIRDKIDCSENSIAMALVYARIGNYIDFGAMNNVDEEMFLSLFDNATLQDRDREVTEAFIKQCKNAHNFLLITDNCGEIVLDKLFLEQLHKSFPKLKINVLVRGGEVLNDATEEDAKYVGIDKVGEVISNGLPIAGTIYELLPAAAKAIMDNADVILAKGQGNYESLCGQGKHIFYSFLCKCELFTNRFHVPKLTGIFMEELE